MGRMCIHMCYCCRLASGTGSRHGSWLVSSSRRGMRGESGLPTSHHTCLSPHPLTEGGHCIAGANIVRTGLLKQGEHSLRAASCFQR
jgi:hypothetical protein